MIFEGWSLCKNIVVAAKLLPVFSVYIYSEVSKQTVTELNIGQCQMICGNVFELRKLFLSDGKIFI